MTERKRSQAIPVRQIENERTVVTEWRFAPGAETGWHTHEMDYVVVPMTSGSLSIESGEAHSITTTDAPLESGRSYFRQAGVHHNVVNTNDFEFVFVEVEFR